MMLFVSCEGYAAVPHIPNVRVSALIVLVQRFIVGARRAGPVGRLRIEPRNHSGQDAAEYSQIVLPDQHAYIRRQRGARSPTEGRLRLVVAAPQNNTWMIAQAAHLILGFCLDIELEGVSPRLPVVAKHEVLPDHDAQFVADRIELLSLVVATAPVTNHVHVDRKSKRL